MYLHSSKRPSQLNGLGDFDWGGLLEQGTKLVGQVKMANDQLKQQKKALKLQKQQQAALEAKAKADADAILAQKAQSSATNTVTLPVIGTVPTWTIPIGITALIAMLKG